MSQRLTGPLSDIPVESAHSESVGDDREAAAQMVREVTELLEVLWNRGRDSVSTAPVSSSQLRALYVLDHAGGINLRTLGEVLGSAPSSASRMCDRLQALGFIERSLSSTSRREVTLRLTGRGRTYLADLRARRESALTELISAMDPAARASLTRGLVDFGRAADRLAPRTRETGRSQGTA